MPTNGNSYGADANNPSYRKYIPTGASSRIDDTYWKRTSESIFDDYRLGLSDSPVKSIDPSILAASPIADRYDKGYYTKFKRLPILDPFNHFEGATEYIFFTKPDLCICNASSSSLNSSLAGTPIFDFAQNCYPEVLASLQSSARFPGITKEYPKLIPILSNAISSSLDMPDSESNDIETAQNIYGTKIYYRGSSSGSDKEFDFNLEFEDTKQSEIYMFFKIWDEYKKLDWCGMIEMEDHWKDYIAYKVLCDQISLFKVIVAEDGYTILFWAEIVGCYPKGVPRSVWNNPTDLTNYMKITTDWKGHFVKDMDPLSLAHFNKLTLGSGNFDFNFRSADIPIYDVTNMEMDRRWAGRPYIHRVSDHRTEKGVKHPFQLRWLNI